MGPADLLERLWDKVMPPGEFEHDVVIVNYWAPIQPSEEDVYGQYRPYGAAQGHGHHMAKPR